MRASDDVRPTQTKVKHQILDEYLKAWTGIIFWGIRHSRKFVSTSPRFVYVDAFSFKGKYTGGDMDSPRKDSVYGSPVIGIQRLDKFTKYASKNGMPVITNVILLEKNPETYQLLKETLEEIGVGHRVRETTDFGSLRNGEIAVANVDATKMGDKLIAYTSQQYIWSFYLLDPWGPSGIPYEFVQKIVSAPRHDVMINFIYIAFQKNLGLIRKQQLGPREQSKLDLWEKVFGPEIWSKIVYAYRNKLLTGKREKTEVTQGSVVKYLDTLQSMDPEIAVKLTALQFPDKRREMLYLFLTTHDPTGALKLNEVLAEARLLEFELRHRARIAKPIRRGQMSLFPFDEISSGIESLDSSRPDIEEIGNTIMKLFAGQTVQLKYIYKKLADTDYFPGEVQKTLKILRRKKRANFEGSALSNRTWITFRNE